MPKVSEAHTQARRRQILTAAYKCFGRKGFDQTTMRDICQEAGLSLGGLYGYFASKEELVQALAELGRRQTRTFLESVPGADRAPPAARDLLDAAIRNLNIKECLEGIRVDVRLWGESLHTPQLRKLVLQAFENTSGSFVEVIRRGQERGEIKQDISAESAARVFMAIFMGLAVQKAIDRTVDVTDCWEVIASLLDGSFDTQVQPKRRKK
jgi:AcrR family transcriptional regulator